MHNKFCIAVVFVCSVCLWVLYLKTQCSSDERVCCLDAVRLSVFRAVTIRKSLKVETWKEIHWSGGIHQRATRWDIYHLKERQKKSYLY